MLSLRGHDSIYVPRKSGIKGSARAITIEDDSAVDVSKTHKNSFYPGDEIIFDPDQTPKPGDLVVARHPDIIAAAPRIYAERSDPATGAPFVELIPLNSAYRTVRMMPGDGSYICGVAKKVMRNI